MPDDLSWLFPDDAPTQRETAHAEEATTTLDRLAALHAAMDAVLRECGR